jgi:hypothetical protein
MKIVALNNAGVIVYNSKLYLLIFHKHVSSISILNVTATHSFDIATVFFYSTKKILS